MHALWDLLRTHRDFRRLVSANLISLTGDWMLGIGLAYFVYALTGSTLASAGALLCAFLPSIFLGSFAGVFVDRWNRKTTMIVANVLMAVGLLPLLLVHDPGDIWIVYVITAYEGIIEQFSVPAEQAFLPRVVGDSDLVVANAMNGQTREIARLVGSAIGGITIAQGGLTTLAIADAVTFVVAAILVASIRQGGRPERAVPEQPHVEPPLDEPGDEGLPTAVVTTGRLRALGAEWLAGLRLAGSDRVLRVIFLYVLLAMFGEGVMGTLFAPFVRDVLHGTGQDYGFVTGVQAIGGIVGGVVAASLGRRMSAVAMFGFGTLLFGIVDLTMFLYPLVFVAIWPAAVCMIVVGVPGAVSTTGQVTLLQHNTTDAFRGRVFGALGLPQGIGIVAGTLLAGVLGQTVGIVAIISLQGVMGIVCGVVILVVLRDLIRAGPATP